MDEMVQIDLESKKYGDILMAQFVDSYRNISYKNILGYFLTNKALNVNVNSFTKVYNSLPI